MTQTVWFRGCESCKVCVTEERDFVLIQSHTQRGFFHLNMAGEIPPTGGVFDLLIQSENFIYKKQGRSFVKPKTNQNIIKGRGQTIVV